MTNYKQYLVRCKTCGANTSKAYARKNDGKCKACVTGIVPDNSRKLSRLERDAEYRAEFIIDHGWEAYAREEGHYDNY